MTELCDVRTNFIISMHTENITVICRTKTWIWFSCFQFPLQN